MHHRKSKAGNQESRAAVAMLRLHDETGQTSGLACPRCEQPAVNVRFTHAGPNVYRTWFICTQCEFVASAGGDVRPAHFRAGLVDESLERLDEETLSRSKFRWPDPDDETP